MALLKNGGWSHIGRFSIIRWDAEIEGQRVQIISFDEQLDQNGQKRSRQYYELRDENHVIQMPTKIRSLKAARAWTEEYLSTRHTCSQPMPD